MIPITRVTYTTSRILQHLLEKLGKGVGGRGEAKEIIGRRVLVMFSDGVKPRGGWRGTEPRQAEGAE